jgi:hypothetical protein
LGQRKQKQTAYKTQKLSISGQRRCKTPRGRERESAQSGLAVVAEKSLDELMETEGGV